MKEHSKGLPALAKEIRRMNLSQIIGFAVFLVALRLPENLHALAGLVA